MMQEDMVEKWEVVHWPNNKQVKVCTEKEWAEKYARAYGKGYIVRPIYYLPNGTTTYKI